MFIAFVLYGSLNTFSGLFTGSIQGLSAETIIVMPRYNMFGKLPLSHTQFIETLDGVEDFMIMDYLISDGLESMMDGVLYAASPNFFDIYDRFETSEEALLAFKNNPNAAIVGQLMADQKGLRIGDKLNTEYIEALEEKVEDLIDRKVNFYLASKQNPNQKSITLNENQ